MKRTSLIRATALVTMTVFASKALGFVREMMLAARFGAGAETDAFVMAYGVMFVPILLFGSVTTSTVVPMYSRIVLNDGENAARDFSAQVFWWFCAFGVVAGLACAALAPHLTRIFAMGFDVRRREMTTQLLRTMMPALTCFVPAMVMCALLNARERFFAAQLSGFPLSLCMILACVFAPNLRSLGYAVAVGSALQVMILLPFVRGFGVWQRPHLNQSGRTLELIKLASPAIISMAVNEFNHMIDRTLASTLEAGSVTALNFGFKLITFALGVLIVPMTTVAYTRMSRCAAEQQLDALVGVTSTAVEVVLTLLLPITALCVLLRGDIIRAIYGRGAFDAQAILRTASAFACYALGLTFFGLRDLLNRVFHALKCTRMPMYAACLTVGANVVLNLLLIRPLGANGLALATAISGAIGCVVLCVMLKATLRMSARALAAQTLRVMCATAATVAAVMGAQAVMRDIDHAWVRLICLSGVGVLIYGISALVFRVRVIMVRSA